MTATSTPHQAIDQAVSIRQVSKVFGSANNAVRALDAIDLDAHGNEFFTLLGPSGCGKTTLLRIIAGFEEVTSGHVLLYGEYIHSLSPNRRPVNTVFQHYALFPHMTVADNVAFGLRRLGQDSASVARRVSEMLALVQLSELSDRSPSQLSGGQQQRVALARALAPNPKVLLLDEPLSALDLKLRQAMRVELKQLQQDTGITFVFVTHDQEEALTMSDRIAVMSEGKVQQIGTPAEIYEQPVNRFVADFIGDTNLIGVTVDEVFPGGEALCSTAQGFSLKCRGAGSPKVGEAAHVCVRPEKIRLVSEPSGSGQDQDSIACSVEKLIYLGTDTLCIVTLADGSKLTLRNQNAHGGVLDIQPGSRAMLQIDYGAAWLLVD